MKSSGRSARVRRPRTRGFTLIETALAIVIVGTGVLAMVAAQQAFHQKNEWSTHSAAATRLGNEIREMTINLPRHDPVTDDEIWGPETGELFETYDDLDDFDGVVLSAALSNGPRNAMRSVIQNMDGWSQTVNVYRVDPLDLNATPADGDPYLMLVEVIVEYQSPLDTEPTEITRVSWVAPN